MSLALNVRDYDKKGNLKEFVSPIRIISSFLNPKGVNSERTLQEYTYDIEKFFKWKVNKHLEYLTEKDLEIDILEVEEYRLYLKEIHNYANSSINRKITVIRSLYQYLENFYKNNVDVRSCSFNVTAFKHDVKHHGSLSLKEVEKFTELTLEEKCKTWEKYFLIKLAMRTSFRIDVMLSLKWSDINKHDFREDVFMVTGSGGKGKKTHIRPIHHTFYEELLTLKDKYEKLYGDDKIFHLNKMDISRMIERFCDKLNINKERNICFHSIRRFGGNFLKNATGDISLAQQQLDHESIETTMIYIDPNENIDLSVGMLLDNPQENDILEDMSAEDWKNLFMSASKETQLNLIMQAKKTHGR